METFAPPVAWYSSMVVFKDTADGRKAATLGALEEAHGILDDIVRSNLLVEMKGQRRYALKGDAKSELTPCLPETVWASAP
jgi:hypothetical protein